MASHAKVICGFNAKDLKKSKQKGSSKTRRKRIRKIRIRRIKREKEKLIKCHGHEGTNYVTYPWASDEDDI